MIRAPILCFYLSSIRWGMFGTFSCCVYCCCQELFFPSFVSCLTTPFSLALFTIQHDLSYLIAYITKATSIVLFYLKKRLTVIRELTYQLYKAWSIRIGISISRSPWQEIGTRYRQQKNWYIIIYIIILLKSTLFIYLFIFTIDSDFRAALILLPHIFKEKVESLITLGEVWNYLLNSHFIILWYRSGYAVLTDVALFYW